MSLVVGAFGPLPGRILGPSIKELSAEKRLTAESNVRGMLLQAVGGVVLVIGAVTAWRQLLVNRRQHGLDHRIAVTEAFSNAVQQLANAESAAIRLGGVYSLDRIAGDSPGERARIAEILAAFVRDRLTDDPPRDALAALEILTRRDWPGGVDLAGVRLAGARLAGAKLSEARLGGADLNAADLSGADLGAADLTGADLRKARLPGAVLHDAKLRDTRFSGATADAATRWPEGFDPVGHGVLIE